jgi:hypothetical protein
MKRKIYFFAAFLLLLCLDRVVLAQEKDGPLSVPHLQSGWQISGTFVSMATDQLVIRYQGVESIYTIDDKTLMSMQECKPGDDVSVNYFVKDGKKIVSTLINWNDLRSATFEKDVRSSQE